MNFELSGIVEAFTSIGLPGILLLFMLLQSVRHDKSLQNRDELLANTVKQLSTNVSNQNQTNMSVAIAMSRIEAALDIPSGSASGGN